MKNLIFVALLLALSLTVSCTSDPKERLENLLERVENNGNSFNEEEWESVFNELDCIENEIDKKNYSKEELREIGRIKGRLLGCITRTALGDMQEQLTGLSAILTGGLVGFLEAFDIDVNKYELSDEELENIEMRLKDEILNIRMELKLGLEEASKYVEDIAE